MTRPTMSGGEILRKLIHISTGLLALLLPWLTRWQAAGICGAAFLMNWMVLPRVTRHYLERDEDRKRGYAAGILLYPLSVGALCVLFGSRMEVVAAAWGLLAVGDGFATLAGKGLGGPVLPWNPDKRLAGLVAFALAGGAGATILFLWVENPLWAGGSTDIGGVRNHLLRVVAMCALAAAIAAIVETLRTGINDNLSVPLMAGGVLMSLTLVSAEELAGSAAELMSNLLPAVVINLGVAALAWLARSVSVSGVIGGIPIGVAVYTFGGWRSYAILLLFFLVATAATRMGYEQKAARRIAQEEGGRRGARHAMANCVVPAFMAFLSVATPHADLFMVALVASFATAVFDTVSSELGQVYGRRPFLITSLRPVPVGTEGAVSLEGTLLGLAASILLSGAAFGLGLLGLLGWQGAPVAVAAALIGTTLESYLGVILGRAGGVVDNEAMNFTNTVVGASAAIGFCALMVS